MKESVLKKQHLIFLLVLALAGCAPRQALDRQQANLAVLDYTNQAGMLEDQGDLKSAIKVYQRALKLSPGSALLHLLIAQNYYELGNDTLAILYAKRAVKLDPGNADNHLVLGNSYMIAREFPLAIEQYRIASSLKPGAKDIRTTLSGLYDAASMPDSAIAELRRTLALEDDADIRMQLASLLARRGQWAEAMEQYRRILNSDSLNVLKGQVQ